MGTSNNKRIYLGFISIVYLVLAGCNLSNPGPSDFAQIPAGKGYSEGQEIYFSHTEASDPDIALKLSNMMKSPVLFVPSLAQSPDIMLAKVFVFENGSAGKGPLGFQADVFDNPPGSPAYSPLRKIILVNWIDNNNSRILKSANDIILGEENGEIKTKITDVIVNMPFMVWQGGKR